MPEKLTAYQITKLWRQKNKEKHAEQLRRYYLAHKDRISAYQREYAKNRRHSKVNTDELE